jgi:aminopeptidase N
MSRIILLTAFFFIWAHPSVYAQHSLVYESGGELIYEQAAFDVTHYDLDVRVNPSDSTIAGTVMMSAKMVHPSNVIVLDLDPRLQIDSVTESNGESINQLILERSPGSKRVRIYFPETRQPGEKINVSVTYSGKPLVADNPPWDGGFIWDQTPSGEPWIGVACQTIGAWVWWPNKDHPSDKPDSVSLNFTLPDNLVVASNGKLRGTSEAGDGLKTWHWFNSTPINNYNVTLNAAPYKTISEVYQSVSGDEMDVTFWVLPEFYEEGEILFPQFIDQLRFLEEKLGPYPFRADKYGVAHAPYLGMEHQSIIAYGANFRDGVLFGSRFGFDDLHQHELAHEWWGNLVTAWDWRDFWIHEGFGTYMQALYAEHLGGKEAYEDMIRVFRQNIRSNQEIAPREFMSTVDVYGSGRGGDIYYKGAMFLHTLRYLLGDDTFFQSLRRFAYPSEELESVTDGSHVRFATTDDFLKLTEKLSGKDLEWLFEIYLRQSELPRYMIASDEDQFTLKWVVPGNHEFPMPTQIKVNGNLQTHIPVNGVIEFEADPDSVIEIDPNNQILKAESD